MKKRKTHIEFCKEVAELTNNEFEVMDSPKYKNKTTKVNIKHKGCGDVFPAQPSVFLEYLTCKACGYKVNLEDVYNIHSHDDFINYISPLIEGKFEIIDTYTDMDARIKVKHIYCKNEWMVIPRKFLHNQLCPSCDGGLKSSTEDFMIKLYKKYGTEFILMGDYINNKVPVTVFHTSCGKKSKVMPTELVSSTRNYECKHCRKSSYIPENIVIKKGRTKKKKRLTNRTYQTQVNKLTDSRYELVSEYRGTDNLVTIKHLDCGKTFEITAKSFLNNPFCRCCEFTLSAPIRKIIEYLTQQGYRCEPEYIIEDCKNVRALRYDLGLFKGDDFIGCLEFDGIHHFVPVYGVDQFKYVRKIDAIKNDYCNEFDVYLLRIPFWEEKNIEKILKKEIHKGRI